ncbi:hypothetical protein AVEN_166466-1 [Araneus ventricosus]|uniref:Uncharacterized protein n=1 Tax=Araneus ventricosus TaxID=182803 RepID=A0A4Y2KXR8_ARAVE|nr:hypothetical protein AVEN_166466-1 [Araneus ventricosus]
MSRESTFRLEKIEIRGSQPVVRVPLGVRNGPVGVHKGRVGVRNGRELRHAAKRTAGGRYAKYELVRNGRVEVRRAAWTSWRYAAMSQYATDQLGYAMDELRYAKQRTSWRYAKDKLGYAKDQLGVRRGPVGVREFKVGYSGNKKT